MTRAHYPLHPLTLELADRVRDPRLVGGARLPDERCPVPPSAGSEAARSPASGRSSTGTAAIPRCSSGASATRTRRARAAGFTRYVTRARPSSGQLDPTRLVGLSAFPGYPTVGKQAALHEARRARRERLLRLVPGAAGLDRRPRRARALPRAASRRLSAPGAVRDGVRRRGEPRRARFRRRAPMRSSRTSSPTT